MRKPEGEGVAQSMGRSSTGSRVPATPSPLPEHRPLSSLSSTTAAGKRSVWLCHKFIEHFN